MKLTVPEYYRNFRCIAGKCTDSCCIGWGICIDDKTAELYRSVGGEFGEKLRKNIDSDQCFINDGKRRCPFLNSDNLCEIIITLGEDKLCDICDRHPRYFEWLSSEMEGGIGLSCEEAARLILTADSFAAYETEAPDRLAADADDEPIDEDYLAFLRAARGKLISLLTDSQIPLETALRAVMTYGAELQRLTDEYEIFDVPELPVSGEPFDPKKAAELLSELEPEDESQSTFWRGLAESIAASPELLEPDPSDEKELRNIAVYFIWRYLVKAVFSGQICTKISLAVFGTRVICAMFKNERRTCDGPDIRRKCALAKQFSKLAEYSEDNIFAIYDAFEPD